MGVFVDTSGIVEFLNADGPHHPAARGAWEDLVAAGEYLITTNYIIAECAALLQNRMGMAAVKDLFQVIAPSLNIHWVKPDEHEGAVRTLLLLSRRQLSLIDCVSFDVMRRLGIARAFTLDRHYADQGFACLPEIAP